MTTCPNCGKEIEVSSKIDKYDGKGKKNIILRWILVIALASLILAIAILFLAIFGQQQKIRGFNPNTLNLKFECFDSNSGKNIADCSIHLRVVEQSQIQEFDVLSTRDEINIPVRIRLSIIVTSPGYLGYSEIFEYTDLGETQVHVIKLQESVH
ncbi:MAG: hypothetical protein HZB50_00210 [Chloroflexi bacterium]|nr:hypothetical protein [Chloroflexota bacterium]